MTCIKLAVYDDEDVSSFVAAIKGVDISTIPLPPESFEEDIRKLRGEFDAMLMDLKLNEHGAHVTYNGTAIIQELRSKMALGEIPSVPIILWSMAENIRLYTKEKSSHNLVDAVWKKQDISPTDIDSQKRYGAELASLSEGYELINTTLNAVTSQESDDEDSDSAGLLRLFGDLNGTVPYLPEQIKDFFLHKNNLIPHTIAQFFLNSVLRYDGILLKESSVAARLGIDLRRSSEWSVVADSLEEYCRYKGVFSGYHSRWWSYAIEDWWESNISSNHLASLSSEERVVALKEKFGLLDLVEAVPSHGHSGSKFWFTCLFDQVPLDPVDAFKLVFTEKRDWQDNIYCSYEAIMNRKHKAEGFTLAGQDLERFLILKERLKDGG